MIGVHTITNVGRQGSGNFANSLCWARDAFDCKPCANDVEEGNILGLCPRHRKEIVGNGADNS